MFEGDILIKTNELVQIQSANEARQKRAGSGMPVHPMDDKDEDCIGRLWPNCTIPYKWDQFICKLQASIHSIFVC